MLKSRGLKGEKPKKKMNGMKVEFIYAEQKKNNVLVWAK